MLRYATAAVAVVLLFGAPASAQDKAKKPLGTWTRAAGDVQVQFKFEADTLRCTLSGMGLNLVVDADYGMSKDGVIFGRISKVDKNGVCVGPNAGDLFTFRIALKGTTLTLSELGPQGMNDARELIEGEYKGAGEKK